MQREPHPQMVAQPMGAQRAIALVPLRADAPGGADTSRPVPG
jgi:hypothetical protein